MDGETNSLAVKYEQAHKDMIERVKNLNEFVVTVLKYHVFVEQRMVDLLEAYGKEAENTFAQKIKQCELLHAPDIDAATFEVLRKANRLRNAVAHKIEGDQVKTAMTEARTAYAALSDQAAEDEKKMTDLQLALSCFTHCGTFIMIATDAKKGQ